MSSPLQCAADFRENMRLNASQPVPEIVQLIKDAEYEFLEQEFPEDFFGFTQMVDSYRFLIGFNSKHLFGNAFKRFTLAHELGHVAMHHDILRNGKRHLSFSTGHSNSRIEREADMFAACFLMPPRAFSKKSETMDFSPSSLRLLAEHYGVSELATAIHFVEHTDLACSLIVADASGKTRWENRSTRMKALARGARYVCKSPVPATSATAEWLKGRQKETKTSGSLLDWMPDLEQDIETEEWVMKTPNNLYMALLTPTSSEIELEDS